GPKRGPPLEDRRQPSFRVERDPAVLLVLRRRARNADLAGVPVHALVLDEQHLAAPATEFQRTDEAVMQEWSDELMLGRVHLLQRRIEQQLFFISRQAAVARRLHLL